MKKLYNLFAIDENGNILVDVLGHDPETVRQKMRSKHSDKRKLKMVMVSADYDLMDRYINAVRYTEPGCFMTVTTDASGFTIRNFFETIRDAQSEIAGIKHDTGVQLYSITHREDGHRIFRELYSRVVLKD